MVVIARSINTVLNLRDRMSSRLRNISGNTRILTSTVTRSDRAIQKFASNARKKLSSVAKKMKNVASAGVAMAGVLASKAGFSEAFDMEGFKVQLETATKSTEIAGKKMAWAVKFANDTPFETGSVIEATARLEAMKLNAEKWLPDIADMAGSTAKEMGQAYEAVIDATMGEFERLKEFGIRKNDIMLRAEKKFGKDVVFNSKGSVVDQIKLQEVLMEEMQSRYKGGAEKLSKTTKGLWSTITGVTKTSLAQIVGMQTDGTIKQGSLLEKVKGKLESLGTVLQKWQSDGTINKISDGLVTGIGKMLKVMRVIFGFLMKHEKTISTVLVTFLGFIAVIKVVNAVKFAMAGLSIAIQLFNGTLALTPIGWIIIGITALIAVIYVLYRNWDTVSAFMKSAFEVVSQYLSEKIEMMKLLFFGFVEGVKAGAQGIKDGFLGVFGFIGDAGKGFLNTFSGGINKVIELINGVSVEIPDWVPKFGGQTFGFDIPKIPKYQLGTSYHKGGPAQINERGGEIVNLPNGSKVIPADKSQKLLSSSGGINVQIIIQGNVYGEAELVERVGSKITKKLKLALANM